MGLPEGHVIEQAYVILLKLDKNKEVLVSNDWGKLGETQENFDGSKSLLNMTLFLRTTIGLGCFIHRSHHHGPRQIICIWGNATDPSHQCRYMFKRCGSVKSQPCSTHCHTLSFIHFMTATLNHKSQFVFTSSQSLASFRVTDVGFIKALL